MAPTPLPSQYTARAPGSTDHNGGGRTAQRKPAQSPVEVSPLHLHVHYRISVYETIPQRCDMQPSHSLRRALPCSLRHGDADREISLSVYSVRARGSTFVYGPMCLLNQHPDASFEQHTSLALVICCKHPRRDLTNAATHYHLMTGNVVRPRSRTSCSSRQYDGDDVRKRAVPTLPRARGGKYHACAPVKPRWGLQDLRKVAQRRAPVR